MSEPRAMNVKRPAQRMGNAAATDDAEASVGTSGGRPQSATDASGGRLLPILRQPAAWFALLRRAATLVLPPLILSAALLLLWQWYANTLGTAGAVTLPPPTQVWSVLVAQRDILWNATQVTLQETLVGFAAALAAGFVCGTIIDFSPWLRSALYPLLVTSQTIPIITLAPLLVLWFGFALVLLWSWGDNYVFRTETGGSDQRCVTLFPRPLSSSGSPRRHQHRSRRQLTGSRFPLAACLQTTCPK